MTMFVQKSRFFPGLGVGSLLIGLMAGCHVGPRYQAPAPPTVTAPNFKESTVNFQDQDGWKVASPQDAMIRGNWWEVFQEPELNALEEQLNVNNENIKVSFENFMAARAVVAEARAQYWPTITFNPSYTRARTSSNQNITATTSSNGISHTGQTYSLWTLPVDVQWTPDFWGKIRNQVRQAQSQAQMSAADLEVEKLTEQASLAQFFFEIRGQDMLQKILDETVVADQKSLDAAQGAFDAGTGDQISVAEAQATLKSVQASATAAKALRAQYEHAIAMLVGKIPTDFSIPVRPMIYKAPPIPTGVPSQLIERRPDIAAAERTLSAANAEIGIGYGAFFPQVTLSASGGYESAMFRHLFDWPSRIWSIGPSASQVIFDGGLYRAALHQYTAIYNGDLATYRQNVLTAFQQVEDSMSSTRITSQQVLRQQEAVQASQQYLDLEMQRYQAGLDPYVDVVIAQTTLLNNQATLNAAQVQEMLSAVQLVQALGGGWDRSQLASTKQVTAKAPATDYKLQQ